MNQTSGDSQKFDIVFMSLGKEEKGFKVEAAGEKENIFEDSMAIKVEDGRLLENDTMETASGLIKKFSPNTYKNVKANRQERKTKTKIRSSEIEK